MTSNMSEWIEKNCYWSIQGKECEITLERRPYYCDRGNWIAKVFPTGGLAMDIDSQDGWPRYYFSFENAKSEVEAWLKKRRQWVGVEDPNYRLVDDDEDPEA
jgi:hypothetical protein